MNPLDRPHLLVLAQPNSTAHRSCPIWSGTSNRPIVVKKLTGRAEIAIVSSVLLVCNNLAFMVKVVRLQLNRYQSMLSSVRPGVSNTTVLAPVVLEKTLLGEVADSVKGEDKDELGCPVDAN